MNRAFACVACAALLLLGACAASTNRADRADSSVEEAPAAAHAVPAARGDKSAPDPDCPVIVIFVDGLRPDVLMEMAREGRMPTFSRLFLENGVWVRNVFTALPSHTLTSYASMATGSFSHRHGVKMQLYYNRIRDSFSDGLGEYEYARIAREVERRNVKAIYDYFPGRFSAGILPFRPRSPRIPHLNLVEWAHRGVNTANYGSNIRNRIDDVQTRYALDMISQNEKGVVLVWLPAVDVESHRSPGGQFDEVRPVIAHVDACLARIERQVKARVPGGRAYYVLWSDHGHVGGGEVRNRIFDLEREVFHARLNLNTWSGWHRFACPGADPDHVGVISDADGAVAVTLPHGRADSGDLAVPNRVAQLQNYALADGRNVDALRIFAEHRTSGPAGGDGATHKPVDFVAARCGDDATILVHRTSDSQALITRRRNPRSGRCEFMYRPVRHYREGEPIPATADADPFGYLSHPDFARRVRAAGADVEDWLGRYHSGREWLHVTAGTEYPGAVDALSFFFLDEPLPDPDDTRPERAAGEQRDRPDALPDMLLFAARGWVFLPDVSIEDGHEEIAGSCHGMAFRDSVRICCFFAGPGIRRGGVIETPHRIVDILPTILDIRQQPYDPAALDGAPITGIWSRPESTPRPAVATGDAP